MVGEGRALITGIRKKLYKLYMRKYTPKDLKDISFEIIILEQYLKQLLACETKDQEIIKDMLSELEEAKSIIYRMYSAYIAGASRKRGKRWVRGSVGKS